MNCKEHHFDQILIKLYFYTHTTAFELRYRIVCVLIIYAISYCLPEFGIL